MNNYRQIVSIVLLITSAVLILTGGLILLHLDSRTVMHLHKYFGMAFMGAAITAWDMTRPHGYGRYARDTTFFCR
ncbi:hypothetical protein [Desulfovibrio piger]|uniref:hypothetical protein n=1 Tax=Desulfovibrio piger TaxID=901 RepID=UPI0039F551AA